MTLANLNFLQADLDWGGEDPIRGARHVVDQEDIEAVITALRGDWLTTGPMVGEFEREFAQQVDAPFAVALSSGTAALHATMSALGVKAGDEVIVPTLTFVATANCVVYCGATPVFADVDPQTLLIDPFDVERKITDRTRVIVAMDYAGQPCDYDALRELSLRYGLHLVSDACHSLGGSYRQRKVGTLADISVFSLHPAKAMTTGEGGMVVTPHESIAMFVQRFRNHGIDRDARQREKANTWQYEMHEMGYNYRISDIQCALGRSQLKKLAKWIKQRQLIAERYDAAFSQSDSVSAPLVHDDRHHARHLYPLRLRQDRVVLTRDQIFRELRARGIGVNVHFVPVHLQPYYRNNYSTGPRLCPNAEQAYEELFSLPIYSTLTSQEVSRVISAVIEVTRKHER